MVCHFKEIHTKVSIYYHLQEASGQLDLRACTTRRVELVSRDVCARQHTFQLTLLRPAHPRDVTNLVQEVKGSSLITK